ncbi:hypothetical protein QAD02_001297 [Eretmocerus hayati]|uniref:Uncharacterized protein n=1 Tax=Eretmocerus hayati TaxID=131215 RepID=A0ACC2NGV6_9HYME|nr:hypothetical protein QAD02_001297 [Eretmocerus hayati]
MYHRYICNCKDAISAAFRKLMGSYNGPVSEEVCLNCPLEDRTMMRINCCIFDVDPDVVIKDNYETLQRTFENKLSDQSTHHCRQCLARSLEQQYVTGPYICFDTSEAHRNGHKSQLSSVPTEMTLRGEKYVLSGLIQYRDYDEHFIAYCRSPTTGSWKVKNDLVKRAYVLKNDEDLHVHMLFYVRVTMYQSPVSANFHSIRNDRFLI